MWGSAAGRGVGLGAVGRNIGLKQTSLEEGGERCRREHAVAELSWVTIAACGVYEKGLRSLSSAEKSCWASRR